MSSLLIPQKTRVCIGLCVCLVLTLALAHPIIAASPWIQVLAMPYTPAYHSFIAAGTQLFVIGGDIGSGPLNKILIGRVGGNGLVIDWSENPFELPQPLAEHATVVIDRWAYLIGGSNGKTALRSTISAEIPTGGPIGPWQAGSILLPEALRGHAGASLERTIYVIGGTNDGGKVRNQVYRAAVDPQGQLQAWQVSGTLPQPLTYSASATSKKTVYIIGGEDEKGPVQAVYAGFAGPGGELTWKSQRALPKASSRGAAFVNGGTLFYIGGYDGTTTSSDAYAAPINADGSIGEWIGWLPLPKGLMGLRAALLNGRAYLAGGFDGARFTNALQLLPIDTPTPIATATPTPLTIPAPKDIIPAITGASGIVALVSFLVVVIALVKEKHTPA